MAAKNNFPKHYFILPPGRLISGSVTTKNTTDMHGKPKDSPSYWFAVAVPKATPAVGPCIQEIINQTMGWLQGKPEAQAAQIALQSGFEAPAGFKFPPFSWKIHDGDIGKWAGREGTAGCWIFELGTTLSFVTADAQNIPIDPATISLGYWVDVATMIQFNGNAEKPGIYMNPQGIRLLGYGAVITPGPSAAQLFGATPASLPAGASATPLATAQPQVQQPQQYAQPQVQQPQQYAQPQVQQPQQYAQPQVQQPQQYAQPQVQQFQFGASPPAAAGPAGATPGNFQFASAAGAPVTAPPAAAPARTVYPFNPDPRFLTGQ